MYILFDLVEKKVIAKGSLLELSEQTKIGIHHLNWSYNMGVKIVDGRYKVVKERSDK